MLERSRGGRERGEKDVGYWRGEDGGVGEEEGEGESQGEAREEGWRGLCDCGATRGITPRGTSCVLRRRCQALVSPPCVFSSGVYILCRPVRALGLVGVRVR